MRAGLGGDDRPGQRLLTEAVAAALDDSHHLVAQAPTGSGKSLAYLAPAVASGRATVVATATLALQDQLWRKDLPLVAEQSGIPFEAAVLKGRAQYLCLARLRAAVGGEALFDERPGPDLGAELIRLERFAADSETGDASDADVTPGVWRSVSCGPNECPGATRCPAGEDCFAEHARRRADGADILVVNHALYLAHLAAGGILLPHHEVVIVDEAHALADTATRALGSEVAPGGLRHLAARLRGAGVPAADADAVAEAAERLEDVLGDLGGRVDPTEERLAGVLAGPRSGSRPPPVVSTSAVTHPAPPRPPGWPRPASTRSAASKRPAATKWRGSTGVSGRCCAWRRWTSGRG